MKSQQMRPFFALREERWTARPGGLVHKHSVLPPFTTVVADGGAVVRAGGAMVVGNGAPVPSMAMSMQFQNCSPQAVCQNHCIVQVSQRNLGGNETATSCAPC